MGLLVIVHQRIISYSILSSLISFFWRVSRGLSPTCERAGHLASKNKSNKMKGTRVQTTGLPDRSVSAPAPLPSLVLSRPRWTPTKDVGVCDRRGLATQIRAHGCLPQPSADEEEQIKPQEIKTPKKIKNTQMFG